jgi:hypothetical protein
MSEATLELTAKGFALRDERIASLEAQLHNTERQLAAYKDKIDKDELVRCLRAARDSHLSETIRLKDKIAELHQENDGLRDDNLDLSAMLQSARQKQFAGSFA